MNVLKALGTTPIVALDLGARGGIDQDLIALAPAVVVFGFEPDPIEARRLSARPAGPWKSARILPYAVGRERGSAKLYLAREPEAASLLPHNPAMIEMFGQEGLHHTIDELDVEVMTLDDAAASAGLKEVDYLKIDIEGAELGVLQGGRQIAETAKIMKIECAFIEQRVGQALAADVIEYLAERGFDLFDIRSIQRWRRRPMPAHPYVVSFEMPYSRGSIAQADLFFVKRFDVSAGGRDVAAAMCILAALGYLDQAVTLLRSAPSGGDWWRDRGVDIEASLRAASLLIGQDELSGAIRRQLRGLVPLLKSRFGMLGYRPPSRRY